jgi:DNA-binding NarL/FixJ family response regulator
VDALRALHLAAGEPSLREIAARAPGISRDTVHSVLTAPALPRWPALESVVLALGGQPERFGALWRAARLAEDTVDPRLVEPSSVAAPPVQQAAAPADPPAAPDGGMPVSRLVIVEDHPLFRESLRTLLERDGFEVLAAVGTADEGVRTSLRLLPDVVVMDLGLPDGNGLDATESIRAGAPGIRVVVVSAADDPYSVAASIRAGAVGYLLKSDRPEAILDGIRRVATGQRAFSPVVVDILVSQGIPVAAMPVGGLTAREQDVLRLLAQGRTNSEIAMSLGISARTVGTHIERIRQKLRVHRRAELIMYAVKNGLD